MNEQKAWYKQFWPWFLIFLPLCAVVASFTTLKIAIDNSDSLVAEEYYKDGKAINMDLAKNKYAKQIGMQFLVTFTQDNVRIVQHGGPEYLAGLKVKFYHPTLEEKDLEVLATANAEKAFTISVDEALTGTWEVRLESYDSKWRIHKRITITEEKEYWLN